MLVLQKRNNALGTLVHAEKPSFQTLSEGLIVLLCTEVVQQGSAARMQSSVGLWSFAVLKCLQKVENLGQFPTLSVVVMAFFTASTS